MNWKIRAATTLALAAASVATHAEQRVGDLYVAPSAGYTWLDPDRGAQDDLVLGVTIGKHFTEFLSGEVTASRGSYDLPGDRTLHLNTYTLDLLHIFAREAAVSPFVSAGIGAMSWKPDGIEHGSHKVAQAGLGLMIDVASKADGTMKFGFRPEVKARWAFPRNNDPQDKFLDYTAGLGFMLSFGSPPPVAAPEPAPAPPPPPPPPPPPADSDGDGVTDDRDKCPDTPRGVAVDEDGCPRRGSVTLQGVTFEYDSANLTSDSRPVLDKVAAYVKRYPRLKIELQGHTDSMGSDKYNQQLSEKRAQSVRDYLLSQGVGEQQLTAKGYGESEPVADNKTDEGRSQNRRVVMMVLENPGEVKITVQEPKD